MPGTDADGAVAELAASRHSVVTRRQAASLGWDHRLVRRRLAAGVVHEPVPGVLVFTSSPSTWRQQLVIATLAGRGEAAASHRAAAALHRLDGVAEGSEEVSVHGGRRVRAPGLVCHQVAALQPVDLLEVDGIRCTTIARTLADLGSVVPVQVVQKALDDARRRKVSLRWIEEAAVRLHRPGQRGTGVLLELLREAEGGGAVPESWLERVVAQLVRSPLLPEVVRQHPVFDADRRFVARVDLAVPALRLAIEAHSRRFHFGAGAEAADHHRDLRLAACGWEVLYLGWQDHRRPAEVRRLVEQVAGQRAALLGVDLVRTRKSGTRRPSMAPS